MLPNHLSGLGSDSEAGIRAGQCSARCTALCLRCRSGATRAVVDQIEFGIIAELTPDARHPAFLIWRAGPCLVTGLSWVGNHLIPPEFPAGSGVVTRDVTAVTRKLTRSTCDDHPIRDDWARGVADFEVATAIGLPDDFAATGSQRNDDVIPAHEVDLVGIDGNAPLALPESVAHGRGRRPRMPI